MKGCDCGDFSFSASDENAIRQYQSTTKKKIDDVTRTGVFLGALATNSGFHKKLGGHLVLRRVSMKREIQDFLGMKQWLTPGRAEVMAVGSGKGKQTQPVSVAQNIRHSSNN